MVEYQVNQNPQNGAMAIDPALATSKTQPTTLQPVRSIRIPATR